MAVAVGGAAAVAAATTAAVTATAATTATVVVAAGGAVAIALARAYGIDEITRGVRHYALFRLHGWRGLVLIIRLDRQGRYGYQAEHGCFQDCFVHDVVPPQTRL